MLHYSHTFGPYSPYGGVSQMQTHREIIKIKSESLNMVLYYRPAIISSLTTSIILIRTDWDAKMNKIEKPRTRNPSWMDLKTTINAQRLTNIFIFISNSCCYKFKITHSLTPSLIPTLWMYVCMCLCVISNYTNNCGWFYGISVKIHTNQKRKQKKQTKRS